MHLLLTVDFSANLHLFCSCQAVPAPHRDNKPGIQQLIFPEFLRCWLCRLNLLILSSGLCIFDFPNLSTNRLLWRNWKGSPTWIEPHLTRGNSRTMMPPIVGWVAQCEPSWRGKEMKLIKAELNQHVKQGCSSRELPIPRKLGANQHNLSINKI